MKLLFDLDSQAISYASAARSKDLLFAEIATLADKVYGLDAKLVEEGLLKREALGTTGFGQGVAIPHARIEGLDRTVCLIVRPESALSYGSVDEEPVDLVFALLSPAVGGATHLKALAEISRMLRDKKMAAKLRGATSADTIYAVVWGHETRNAA